MTSKIQLYLAVISHQTYLYTATYYINHSLVYHLLNRNIHLVGTLRGHWKYLLQYIVTVKLKKGEFVANTSKNSILWLMEKSNLPLKYKQYAQDAIQCFV